MLSRDMEDIKAPSRILEVKTTIPQKKNIQDGINGRFDISEEKIDELE